MLEEFKALIRNGIWELVPLAPTQNLVGCKWVFRIKRNSDGTVHHYKAWLVAKGYTQQLGIDYTKTFGLVIKKNLSL